MLGDSNSHIKILFSSLLSHNLNRCDTGSKKLNLLWWWATLIMGWHSNLVCDSVSCPPLCCTCWASWPMRPGGLPFPPPIVLKEVWDYRGNLHCPALFGSWGFKSLVFMFAQQAIYCWTRLQPEQRRILADAICCPLFLKPYSQWPRYYSARS